MKTYYVNVHYDVCLKVEVKADSQEDAIDKAESLASGMDLSEGDAEFTDSCILGVKDEEKELIASKLEQVDFVHINGDTYVNLNVDTDVEFYDDTIELTVETPEERGTRSDVMEFYITLEQAQDLIDGKEITVEE